MGVDGPRVGIGKACGQMRPRGIGQRPKTERAIHMHPGISLTGPGHDLGERIERTRVDLPCLGADHGRSGDVPGQPRRCSACSSGKPTSG
jgi:hypothetical protein